MAVNSAGVPKSKPAVKTLPCKDFSEFKEALQQMRKIDDSIIYKLNSSVPTASFADQVDSHKQCKELYEQLQDIHKIRTSAIQNCISETSSGVLVLKERRDASQNGRADVVKELRKEQTKLRSMEVELEVESIIRERSLKVYSERCWKAYKPPDNAQ